MLPKRLLTLSIFVALVFAPASGVRAQSDSLRLQRFEYVIGSVLSFSFADYLMLNHLRADGGWQKYYVVPPLYRIVQGAVQAGITYLLYKKFGLPSAISFTLMQWTGVTDWAYTEWENILPWMKPPNSPGPPAENTWSSWTPVGIVRPLGSPISQNTLHAQAAIGFALGVTLLW